MIFYSIDIRTLILSSHALSSKVKWTDQVDCCMLDTCKVQVTEARYTYKYLFQPLGYTLENNVRMQTYSYIRPTFLDIQNHRTCDCPRYVYVLYAKNHDVYIYIDWLPLYLNNERGLGPLPTAKEHHIYKRRTTYIIHLFIYFRLDSQPL